jgi:hypothetical protein
MSTLRAPENVTKSSELDLYLRSLDRLRCQPGARVTQHRGLQLPPERPIIRLHPGFQHMTALSLCIGQINAMVFAHRSALG